MRVSGLGVSGDRTNEGRDGQVWSGSLDARKGCYFQAGSKAHLGEVDAVRLVQGDDHLAKRTQWRAG